MEMPSKYISSKWLGWTRLVLSEDGILGNLPYGFIMIYQSVMACMYKYKVEVTNQKTKQFVTMATDNLAC